MTSGFLTPRSTPSKPKREVISIFRESWTYVQRCYQAMFGEPRRLAVQRVLERCEARDQKKPSRRN